jgi:hypothetical protein
LQLADSENRAEIDAGGAGAIALRAMDVPLAASAYGERIAAKVASR